MRFELEQHLIDVLYAEILFGRELAIIAIGWIDVLPNKILIPCFFLDAKVWYDWKNKRLSSRYAFQGGSVPEYGNTTLLPLVSKWLPA